MTDERWDVVVIGGGHNGLVSAACLARAGRSVLVLERRAVLGGAAATEPVFPGFRVDTGAVDLSRLHPAVVREMDLEAHGLELVQSPVSVHAPDGDGGLTLWLDPARTAQAISRHSRRDAARFPDFARLLGRMGRALRLAMLRTPPPLPGAGLADLAPWGRVALELRRHGRRDFTEFLRMPAMPVSDLLDDWFESDRLKGALAVAAVQGCNLGPRAAGTALGLLTAAAGAPDGAVRALRVARGGSGALAGALAAAATGRGAAVRRGAVVAEIVVEDGRAAGVRLADGERIRAGAVLSGASPRATLLDLLDAEHLAPDVAAEVDCVKYRGTTARVVLALDGLPASTRDAGGAERWSGHTVVCPDLDHLEHAADDAKYGRVSAHPALEVTIPTLLDPSLAPEGAHIACVDLRYAPYRLRGSDWDAARDGLTGLTLSALERCAPGISAHVTASRAITPLDYERDYGLAEGGIHHGQMGLDQLAFMRPVGACSRYRTPVPGLYITGAGTHPGGGVTGAPGYNAARELLRDRAAAAAA